MNQCVLILPLVFVFKKDKGSSMKYKIGQRELLCILYASCLAISGCKFTPPQVDAKNRPFIELIGSWSSGPDCHLNITEINGNLYLREFVAENTQLKLARLISKKDGIMIDFRTQEQVTPVHGSLSDGNMIVDKYCPYVLHKTNGF